MGADRPEVVTSEEYAALVAAEARRGRKYRNTPVRDPEDGYFDSTGEHARWCQLKLLRDAGAIANLRRQVRYPLVVGGVKVATYVADFVYEEGGKETVEDWKGFRTSEYRLKARLMLACWGITILETG
jgi:hypothetical protein